MSSQDEPLPDGWEVGRDYDGRLFYIDHINKITTWIDPRPVRRNIEPKASLDNMSGDILPAYERASPGHVECVPRIDSRTNWKALQENMLTDYLKTAQEDLDAKCEIFGIKQQRLHIAQTEYDHLHGVLSKFSGSRQSLYSCSSGNRYDLDLLQADIAHAQARVARLKRELRQVEVEVQRKQKGLDTLAQMNRRAQGSSNSVSADAHVVFSEIQKIQYSLSCGEQERQELIRSLAQLKNDILIARETGASGDDTYLHIPQERLCTASQTDLSGEMGFCSGMSIADLARKRLQYDETRKEVRNLQHRLAQIHSQTVPGQKETDYSRLRLIQEQESLLQELCLLDTKGRSSDEINSIRLQIAKMENDLRLAVDATDSSLAMRLQLDEEKSDLITQLRDVMQKQTSLEFELKNLSTSTLSISSNSSRGSLSAMSTGSIGSTSSIDGSQPFGSRSGVNMEELRQRVERLLQSSSSRSLEGKVTSDNHLSTNDSGRHTHVGSSQILIPTEILSIRTPPQSFRGTSPQQKFGYISSNPCDTRSAECCTPGNRPVSTFRSNFIDEEEMVGPSWKNQSVESINKDSGVFEADEMSADSGGTGCQTARALIRVCYNKGNLTLKVGIQALKNISSLSPPANCMIGVSISLLPPHGSGSDVFVSERRHVAETLSFTATYKCRLVSSVLLSKTLQVGVIAYQGSNEETGETLGSLLISLAELSETVWFTKWFNIVSIRPLKVTVPNMQFRDLQLLKTITKTNHPFLSSLIESSGLNLSDMAAQALEEDDLRVESDAASVVIKEDRDDLTLSSGSQASTLTRGQRLDASQFEESGEEDSQYSEGYVGNEDFLSDLELARQFSSDLSCDSPSYNSLTAESGYGHSATTIGDLCDKETNTESNFITSIVLKNSQRRSPANAVVKRSHTFNLNLEQHRMNLTSRLNRSDSDSCVPMQNGQGSENFARQAFERRSLRNKKPAKLPERLLCHGKAIINKTPLHLEVDLKASQLKLQDLIADVSRLRTLSQQLENLKNDKDAQLPEWFADLEYDLEKVNSPSDNSGDYNCSPKTSRIAKLLRRTLKEIQRFQKNQGSSAEIQNFQKSMAALMKVGESIHLPSLGANRVGSADLSTSAAELEIRKSNVDEGSVTQNPVNPTRLHVFEPRRFLAQEREGVEV